MQVIFAVVLSYLLGSVPFGLILSRLKGRDPRKTGSGNIGATNVVRTAGKAFGVATLAADVLKGYLPVAAAVHYNQPPIVVALIGLALFLGHLFPVYLRFRGGKGVATALGVFLALKPLVILLDAGLFVLILLLWRYVSLGSLICAGLVPLLLLLFGMPAIYIYLSLVIVCLIFIKHAGNIKRLWAGTESRFSFGSGTGTEKPDV